MSKKSRVEEIRARMKRREYMITLVPAWMERTQNYLVNMQQKDKMLVHAIRMGVIK